MGTLKQQVEWHQQELKIVRDTNERQFEELQLMKKRVAEVAAENESLRADKKWLQSMHSAVLQSMHAFASGRHS